MGASDHGLRHQSAQAKVNVSLTAFKVLISDTLEQLTLALSIKHKASNLPGKKEGVGKEGGEGPEENGR